MGDHREVGPESSVEEHRFWLFILGDHGRFIADALSAGEQQTFEQTRRYIGAFDRFLARVESEPHLVREPAFLAEIDRITRSFVTFQTALLKRHLQCAVRLHLPPSFVDHMIREAEEYLRILTALGRPAAEPPARYRMRQHLLWLPDASGHAAALAASVDPQERALLEQLRRYTAYFDQLTLQAQEMLTKFRIGWDPVPALSRLDRLGVSGLSVFRKFLLQLEEMRKECALLGTLTPELLRHMQLEARYYIRQLEAAGAAHGTDET